jgi:hypothetical protein
MRKCRSGKYKSAKNNTRFDLGISLLAIACFWFDYLLVDLI